MITLIVGDIPLLQQRLWQKFCSQYPEAEILSFYGEDLVAATLQESCSTLSLFGSERIVVIRHAEQIPKKVQEALKEQLESLAAKVPLVFIADTIDRRLTFWKQLQKKAQLLSAAAPPVAERRRWLQQEWQRRGRKISAEALGSFADLARDNFAEALQVVERIDLFLEKGDEVTVTTLEQCVKGTASTKIFALTEAIGSRQWPRAFALLQRFWQHQENPHGMLALIARHFRLLLKAKEHEEAGGSRGRIAQVLGVPPYFAEDYLRQSALFSIEQLFAVWKRLRQTDEQLKSSPVKKEWALDEFLITLRGQRAE